MMPDNKICAVIPVFNHGEAIGEVVAAIKRHSLFCILIDDGSDLRCETVLATLADQNRRDVHLERLSVNQGKGAAMMAGFRAAFRLGYTHVLQIDADGQHDARDIPNFLKLSMEHPTRLICGQPMFDDSVPKGRLYGRYLTTIWVWINTLSFSIRDAMCGFRIYPLASTVKLINDVKLGNRMDFDIEVLVRLYWRGIRIINQPTHVTYPSDGVSHFKIWRDNVMISRLHTRLFFGMLVRFPLLIWRKIITKDAV